VKKTKCLAFALPLALVAWPQAPTGAAPRCYPTERFKVLDNQLVRDTLTNLVWQRQASTTAMTWAAAQTYCANAGFRLPTVKELNSIVDSTVGVPGPTIDQQAFPNTPAQAFWTSSWNRSSLASNPWLVRFDDGVSTLYRVEDTCYARCVR